MYRSTVLYSAVVLLCSLLRRRYDMSAMVRSSAHDTIATAKSAMAIHIDHRFMLSMLRMNSGITSEANAQNSPSTNVMSAAFISTDSRKLYFGLCAVSLFEYACLITVPSMPSGVASIFSSSGQSAPHLGHAAISAPTRVLQLRHSQLLLSSCIVRIVIGSTYYVRSLYGQCRSLRSCPNRCCRCRNHSDPYPRVSPARRTLCPSSAYWDLSIFPTVCGDP